MIEKSHIRRLGFIHGFEDLADYRKRERDPSRWERRVSLGLHERSLFAD